MNNKQIITIVMKQIETIRLQLFYLRIMRKNYSVFVMSSILQVSSEYFGFKKILFVDITKQR